MSEGRAAEGQAGEAEGQIRTAEGQAGEVEGQIRAADGQVRKVSRRGFLKGLAAGGLLLGLAPLEAAEAAPAGGVSLASRARAPFDPTVWLAIAPDGTVSILVARSEMGQGTRSTLALAIADELGADRARVHLVQAVGHEALYGSQNTDGSRSIREDLDKLRHVGATARAMLEAAAARRWKVAPDQVAARVHEVEHLPSGRRLGFGALAAAAWKLPVPHDVPLKSRQELRYLGRDKVASLDLDAMVTGRAVYGIDIVRPGLTYAAVARPPVYGGTVATVDERAARAIPGVIEVVRLPAGHLPGGFRPLGGVAVVATHTWAAIQGRNALKITWHDGPNASYDSAAYRQQLEAATRRPGQEAYHRGDAAAALAAAPRRVEAQYYVPHLAHAPMETPVATAEWHGDRLEVWATTQHPQGAIDELAAALAIPKDHITVHVTLLGGGFGRKCFPDYVIEAALLSRVALAPVKVQWTREDEIAHGYFHSVSAQHLEAGLDADARVRGWRHRVAFPPIPSTFDARVHHASQEELGMGLTDLPFDVADLRVETGEAPPHVRIGWFRSVANIQHAFAVGSFVCELAEAAGQDPKDFLLSLLGGDRRFGPPHWNYGAVGDEHPVDTARLARVIALAASQAGWDAHHRGPRRPGHGLGIAAHRSFLSYVATVVEVELAKDGTLAIPRVWTAVDCGFAANPDRIRAQMEGAAVMGASLALYGAVTFKHGRAQQSNFHDFQVARMNAAPRDVQTTIVASDGPPGGVGEPGLPPIAPALCNAIRAAGGPRVRALPIAHQLVRR